MFLDLFMAKERLRYSDIPPILDALAHFFSVEGGSCTVLQLDRMSTLYLEAMYTFLRHPLPWAHHGLTLPSFARSIMWYSTFLYFITISTCKQDQSRVHPP